MIGGSRKGNVMIYVSLPNLYSREVLLVEKSKQHI